MRGVCGDVSGGTKEPVGKQFDVAKLKRPVQDNPKVSKRQLVFWPLMLAVPKLMFEDLKMAIVCYCHVLPEAVKMGGLPGEVPIQKTTATPSTANPSQRDNPRDCWDSRFGTKLRVRLS